MQSPRMVEGSGLNMNTMPPNDLGHYELLDELVQHEAADALDPELAGLFAAVGIRMGETFAPDARLRAILEEGVALGNAASRTLGGSARTPTTAGAPTTNPAPGGTCCRRAATNSLTRPAQHQG
jgi:hypothetical protein